MNLLWGWVCLPIPTLVVVACSRSCPHLPALHVVVSLDRVVVSRASFGCGGGWWPQCLDVVDGCWWKGM